VGFGYGLSSQWANGLELGHKETTKKIRRKGRWANAKVCWAS